LKNLVTVWPDSNYSYHCGNQTCRRKAGDTPTISFPIFLFDVTLLALRLQASTSRQVSAKEDCKLVAEKEKCESFEVELVEDATPIEQSFALE
jgi:hypothetical protein